ETAPVRLDLHLGRPAGVTLRGTNPSQSILFTVPRERRIESAKLDLRLRIPAGLLESTFAALVNGTPVASTRLDGAGPEIRLTAAIPLGALQDYNRLELRAELHHLPS